jgi:hypothetical protein
VDGQSGWHEMWAREMKRGGIVCGSDERSKEDTKRVGVCDMDGVWFKGWDDTVAGMFTRLGSRNAS